MDKYLKLKNKKVFDTKLKDINELNKKNLDIKLRYQKRNIELEEKNILKDEFNLNVKNKNYINFIFDKNKINNFTNILLIDGSINSYNTFYTNINQNTLPIIYKHSSNRQELIEIFTSFNKSSIDRIAFVFDDFLLDNKKFINNESFFNVNDINDNDINDTKNYSDNFNLMVKLIKDFNIKNIDFLVCNSLLNNKWVKYYNLLSQITNVTIGASNDKTGNLKYGGNWVMENTNFDIRNIYFNDGIKNYNSTLVSSTISSNTTIYNSDIINYDWPIYINGVNPITVTFGDDLTLTDTTQYFIIASNNVTVDGNNNTVNFDNVQDYVGLVTLDNSKLYDYINIKNINTISTNDSKLYDDCGWIATSYFSGATECIIQNCKNSADIITTYDICAGICGSRAGFSGICNITDCSNTGNITSGFSGGITSAYSGYNGECNISNCSNTGDIIGDYAGGITSFNTGYYGLCNITNCSNTGNILCFDGGGIASYYIGYNGVSNIINCSNTGDIIGDQSGGLVSDGAGANNGLCNINNCSNTGNITGNDAGGITSYNTGYYGLCNITNCSNTSNITSGYGGGITSFNTGYYGLCNITNCSNTGNITSEYGGGITSVLTGYGGLCNITNCSNTGIIAGDKAGGIVSEGAGYKRECNITDCFNTGDIIGNEAGGITSGFAGYEGECNIKNCFNTGIIKGYYSGGITGPYSGGEISNSICNINNCYNNGNIESPGGGGITGALAGAGNDLSNSCNITNCYNIGKVEFTDAGGICGFIGIDTNYIYNININNCYTLYYNAVGYNSLPAKNLNININNTYIANGQWNDKIANEYLQFYLIKDINPIWTKPSPNVYNLPYLLTSFELENKYYYTPNYLKLNKKKYGVSNPLNVPNTLLSTITSVNNENNKEGITIENNNGKLLFALNKLNGTYEIYTLTLTTNGKFNITQFTVKN